MTRLALFATSLSLLACGDDAPTSPDTSPDATTADTGPSETTPDTIADTIEDDGATSDVADTTGPDVEVEPETCKESAACNMAIDDEGRCPGTCFVVGEPLKCPGVVKDGLCFRYTPFDQETTEADMGDFQVVPITWPADTTVGATSTFEVHLLNKTGHTLELPFRLKEPGNFSFVDATWDGLTTISIPPLEAFVMKATITAQRATIFTGAGVIVTFQFGDGDNTAVWEGYSKIHYPASEGIACGGEHFPETYCGNPDNCYSGSSFYFTAKCCDDVFYPSAQCCTSVDCVGGGGCVDGRCVRDIPALNSANTVPLGNQRVLLVIVEENKGFPFDACADRYDAMKDDLQLDKVEAWFDEVALRRFGRSTLDMKWEVRTGMVPADVLQAGDGLDGTTFLTRVDEYMSAQGCGPVLNHFDKVIVASSGMDLGGYGGIYGNEGRVVTVNPSLPYLLTHELAHSFGAFDLYIDMGGTYQYWSTLMGNNVLGDPYPGDDVAWGEMGYADHDLDGVIDLAQIAAFPESLAVTDTSATLTTKDTLEVGWRFVGREDGVLKDVIVTQYELGLPGSSTPVRVWFGTSTWRIQVYGDNEVDLAALRATGQVTVHIKAELRFTDRDWQRQVKTIDQDVTIPIAVDD